MQMYTNLTFFFLEKRAAFLKITMYVDFLVLND